MPSSGDEQTLRGLGERRIVRELIAPRFSSGTNCIIGIGDDCAVLPAPPPDHALVITTDPCPIPVACLIGLPDMYHYGWLTCLINVSDLASMGARPLGLLVSTVMPEEMTVGDYERFLDGLAEASQKWSCPVIGGNIKDGPEFTATGSALGTVKKENVMRRFGAKPGDRVCVIGEKGLFWAAVLSRLSPNINLDESQRRILNDALLRPVARVNEGIALAETRLVTACMDSSDGLSGCLTELALVNGVDIVVSSESLCPPQIVRNVAKASNIDPLKLMVSWGDWELVATIKPKDHEQIKLLIESYGTTCRDIGQVRSGTGRVLIENEGRLGYLNNFASERFSATSFFTHGLAAYLNVMRDQPLVIDWL